MKLFGTMINNPSGHLEIGGCDVVDLAKHYGTPLYIMDEEHIRRQCRLFQNHEMEVLYASKAFLTLSMCQLVEEEGLSLDVVSGGELYTALKANFPTDRIFFHGNNKTEEELIFAVSSNIHRVILDNASEFQLLESICKKLGKQMDVQLRVNPGISAHTHEYISTTKNDSKFGESIFSELTFDLIKAIHDSPVIHFKGLHSHIGSQIFEPDSFYKQITMMVSFIKTIKQRLNVDTEELNLGGGFGVYYVEGDKPFELNTFLNEIKHRVQETVEGLNLLQPKILIEPGRSIVANAGITLYTVGSTKMTFGKKNYVFVDGSMADNIRTALYDAKYSVYLVNRLNDPVEETYTVTGKCCESGDILVKSCQLPKPVPGDLLAVISTGAYNYTMSMNYNRLTRPAVLFVKEGLARIVVKRETYDDLIRNDLL